MRPNNILDVLRANERTILVGTLLVGGLALLVSLMVPKVYSAESRILISNRNPGMVAVGLGGGAASAQPERDLQTQAEVVRSYPVLEKAIADTVLGVSAKALLESLDVAPIAQTDILSVRASARTAADAAKTANAVALAYVRISVWQDQESIRRAGDQIQLRVGLLDQTMQGLRQEVKPSDPATAPGDPRFMEALARYSELARKLDQARISQETATGSGVIVSAAVADPEQVTPKPLLIGLVGMLVGWLASVAIVMVMPPATKAGAPDAGETSSPGSAD